MKLTRKSYNRRIFTFGALVFLSIALMSTGFATWVMSQNATQDMEGGVNVGTITDGALEFTKEKNEDELVMFGANGNEIRFDADQTDVTGMIKADQTEGAKYENLSVTFTVVVSPKTYYNGMNIKMNVIPEGVAKAAEQGLISLPACASTDGVTIDATNSGSNPDAEVVDTTDVAGRTGVKVTYTVTFSWGEYYDKDRASLSTAVTDDGVLTDNLNPGFWLDDEEGSVAKGLDYATKKAEMIKFRRTIFNRSATSGDANYTSDVDMLSYSDSLKFGITLTAIAK